MKQGHQADTGPADFDFLLKKDNRRTGSGIHVPEIL